MTTPASVTRQNFLRLIKALHAAGDQGLPSLAVRAAMGVTTTASLHEAARYARDRGIPVVALRSGPLSRWWLAKHDSQRHREWRLRIIEDAYAEAVRCHRALKPSASPECPYVMQACVVLGGLLAKPVEDVLAEAQPVPMPAGLLGTLQSLGYLP